MVFYSDKFQCTVSLEVVSSLKVKAGYLCCVGAFYFLMILGLKYVFFWNLRRCGLVPSCFPVQISVKAFRLFRVSYCSSHRRRVGVSGTSWERKVPFPSFLSRPLLPPPRTATWKETEIRGITRVEVTFSLAFLRPSFGRPWGS